MWIPNLREMDESEQDEYDRWAGNAEYSEPDQCPHCGRIDDATPHPLNCECIGNQYQEESSTIYVYPQRSWYIDDYTDVPF